MSGTLVAKISSSVTFGIEVSKSMLATAKTGVFAAGQQAHTFISSSLVGVVGKVNATTGSIVGAGGVLALVAAGAIGANYLIHVQIWKADQRVLNIAQKAFGVVLAVTTGVVATAGLLAYAPVVGTAGAYVIGTALTAVAIFKDFDRSQGAAPGKPPRPLVQPKGNSTNS